MGSLLRLSWIQIHPQPYRIVWLVPNKDTSRLVRHVHKCGTTVRVALANEPARDDQDLMVIALVLCRRTTTKNTEPHNAYSFCHVSIALDQKRSRASIDASSLAWFHCSALGLQIIYCFLFHPAVLRISPVNNYWRSEVATGVYKYRSHPFSLRQAPSTLFPGLWRRRSTPAYQHHDLFSL